MTETLSPTDNDDDEDDEDDDDDDDDDDPCDDSPLVSATKREMVMEPSALVCCEPEVVEVAPPVIATGSVPAL